MWFSLFQFRIRARFGRSHFANGHTSSNTPDPIRTRKLSGERPGQYWGGGPPGKPLGCCWLFTFSVPVRWFLRVPGMQKKKAARTHRLCSNLEPKMATVTFPETFIPGTLAQGTHDLRPSRCRSLGKASWAGAGTISTGLMS